jgi:hypothetical protein
MLCPKCNSYVDNDATECACGYLLAPFQDIGEYGVEIPPNPVLDALHDNVSLSHRTKGETKQRKIPFVAIYIYGALFVAQGIIDYIAGQKTGLLFMLNGQLIWLYAFLSQRKSRALIVVFIIALSLNIMLFSNELIMMIQIGATVSNILFQVLTIFALSAGIKVILRMRKENQKK